MPAELRSASVTLAELDDKSHLPDRATPYFLVEGIEQLSESVTQSKDVSVVLPLEKTHWGTRWIRVQDPDGEHLLPARNVPDERR